MNKRRIALAAFLLAALATAVTQLVHLPFVESALVHVMLDALFIGVTVYLGLRALERSS
jgi:hypothetical protein